MKFKRTDFIWWLSPIYPIACYWQAFLLVAVFIIALLVGTFCSCSSEWVIDKINGLPSDNKINQESLKAHELRGSIGTAQDR